MTLNTVTLTAQWNDGVNYGSGNYRFNPSGTRAYSGEPVYTPAVMGQLDSTGTLVATLIASDNYPAGVLTWNALVEVAGFDTIEFADLTVDHANGSSQDLLTVLQASGWAPDDS